MTVKKLVKSTHPILNKTIQPVSTYDQKLKVLLEDLEDTLYHEEAAAISAPQIGVDQKCCTHRYGTRRVITTY